MAIHTPPRHCEERSDVAIHTPPSLRGAKRRGNPHPPLSLRGAKRRGNPYFRQCKTKAGLLRLRLAMTVSAACNEPYSCHCEEQSDVAIHISGSARRKLDCFACGSQ